VELIDLAQRSNPDTREAWELARVAAARLGGAEAVYLPSLTLTAAGGAQRAVFPVPTGTFSAVGPYAEPKLQLMWTLLDLSRFSQVSEMRARVAEANFAFTRRHQEVFFAVARAYYALDSSRAELEAARATLRSATVVEEAAEARLASGLATRPDVLLAHEARTRAEFDVESAIGAVRTAEGELAESVGVSPSPPLKVASWTRPQTALLTRSVEEVMEVALAERPDLKAQRAAVLARRANERIAKARFVPRLFLDGDVGYDFWRFLATPPGSSFTLSEPTYDVHLRLDWDLFTGFQSVEQLHEAEADRGASEAALAAGSLRALREVWTAYFDVKTAERKIEFAEALLAASEEAYAASLETYQRGLGTLIDLLTAQRDLAAARGVAIASRAELWTAAAALTLAMGASTPAAR
jgi:outer membrane protein TolC